MKKITYLLRMTGILCCMLASVTLISCEDEDEETTGGGNNSSFGGVWTRLPGPSGDRTDVAIGGIDGESSDRVYMCEKRGSTAAGLYKGYIDGSYITWDAEYGLPDTYLEISGGELEFSYPACEVCLVTTYKRGSWDGECGSLSGGGNNPGGGSGNGNVMFWTQSDLGCGFITVNIQGNSGTISGYYSGGSPSCGASSAANFTLPPGNYSFTASCDEITWDGNVTVTSGGCYKMQLTH